MPRTLTQIDADLRTTTDPGDRDDLLDERLQAEQAGPLRPSQVLAGDRP